MTRTEQFWNAYYRHLVAAIEAKPEDYALRAGETAAGYASSTAAKMQRAVESKGRDFGSINYTGSRAFKAAAKEMGVPFNRAGLNSIYGE